MCILLGGCASLPIHDTHSESGAASQHAFFPDCYEYTVGDFVLSLPVGCDEGAMHRLRFAKTIIDTGSPRPALDQEKYLVLKRDALYPTRHFLVLDQKHLLIYSEYYDGDGISPPHLAVLERFDATWNDISERALPEWTRWPKDVKFAKDYSSITITGTEGRRTEQFQWLEGRLRPAKYNNSSSQTN